MTENNFLMMSHRDAWIILPDGTHVNLRVRPAETAGKQYLRNILPVPAGNFTCGCIYLRS